MKRNSKYALEDGYTGTRVEGILTRRKVWQMKNTCMHAAMIRLTNNAGDDILDFWMPQWRMHDEESKRDESRRQ